MQPQVEAVFWMRLEGLVRGLRVVSAGSANPSSRRPTTQPWIDPKLSLMTPGTVLTSNMDGMAAADEAAGARP